MRGRGQILRNTGLFEGIEDEEMETMLKCLGAFTRRYAKDEFLFRRGDRTECLGVVLDGNVRIIREDWWGNRTSLGDVGTGMPLCTEYACTSDPLDVSIVANEPTKVMFLDVGRAANVCNSSCEFHNRLVKNLICAFLSDQARAAGSSDFMIGMNRQEMADYLGVDRSAMSTELGKMQREGIIEFQKNHFVLK